MKDRKNGNGSHLDVILADEPLAHSGRERRQLPRISLGTEQFKLVETGRLFSVLDLSLSGLALWTVDSSDLTDFSVGMKLDGTLRVRDEKFLIQVCIRNLSRNRVGCELIDPPASWGQVLKSFFDPEVLGRSLKPLPALNRSLLWYFGLSGTHLSFKRMNDGQLDQLTLRFLDSLVQWDTEQGIRSGRLVNSEWPSESQGIFRLDTLFFEPDSSMDRERLEVAKKVILSSRLPEDVKSWAARQFSK